MTLSCQTCYFHLERSCYVRLTMKGHADDILTLIGHINVTRMTLKCHGNVRLTRKGHADDILTSIGHIYVTRLTLRGHAMSD